MGEPSEIKKLDEAVINRIAAGEVIQRPANALKEMIENSLDAKATNIQITVIYGGLKLLQVQDNGTGIRKEDFNIVCERFTTSKLKSYDDLKSIRTHGFRGEALASISHVAHLTIISKTCNEECACKASFVDGKLQGAVSATAGNLGTTIIVEDLFYNMKVRKKALRSASEEYRKIADIVGKYAIHNHKVVFGLREFGKNKHIRTSASSLSIDNIMTIYGRDVSKELARFTTVDKFLKFEAYGYVSIMNYSNKKFTFILFINHRLVECHSLKKAIDKMYSFWLPKNKHPFVYLSLELDPASVDVNVHPTKCEVHFLNEDKVVEEICDSIMIELQKHGSSRKFHTQAKLPTAPLDSFPLKDADKINPKDFVRTDSAEQKLEKFFGAAGSEQGTQKAMNKFETSKADRIETQLTSVFELRQSVKNDCHGPIRDIFAQHVFVGPINPVQALFQYSTKLFLCNTRKILYELMYQFVLFNFENFVPMVFLTPFSLRELVRHGLESSAVVGWTAEDGDKEGLTNSIINVLEGKAEMLKQYFSLDIDEKGQLHSIPVLLENYKPNLSGLPLYLIRLGTEVNWETEKECFDSIARETALYYSQITEDTEWEGNNWKWVTEHVIYPAIKDYIIPPKKFSENLAILEIADLPKMYKVFERC